jgi:hypothetical protein
MRYLVAALALLAAACGSRTEMAVSQDLTAEPCATSCKGALWDGGVACSKARGALWYSDLEACACGDDGACVMECGALFCAAQPMTGGDACGTCLAIKCGTPYRGCVNDSD